jgi:hypothetical protein
LALLFFSFPSYFRFRSDLSLFFIFILTSAEFERKAEGADSQIAREALLAERNTGLPRNTGYDRA